MKKFLATAMACGAAACLAHPASAQTSPAACSLLTQAEVSAALAAKVSGGQHIGVNSCEWETSGSPGPHMMATLMMTGPAAYEGARSLPLPASWTRTEVSGLGDGAIYTGAGSYAALTVKKGNSTFVVKVYGMKNRDARMNATKTLAKEAVARL